MAWAPPSKVGDRDAGIVAAKKALAKFSYGKAEGLGTTDVSDVYTAGLGRALTRFQVVVHGEVVSGKRPLPDVNTVGILDWATKSQLGLLAPTTPPAPARRHPAWVFRGTGGIIGADYVSRVCQANADLVEEINVPWAATMGGLPVGTSGGVGDPSMWRGVREAFENFKRDFLARLAVNPKLKAIIGGYSAGAVVAALARQWIQANYPDNYLCSFSIGDPTRPMGGGYYPGIATDGQGISSWRYGDVRDWRHCWLAQPGDMYTSVPLGKVGEIMQGAFDMVTNLEFSNLVASAQAIIPAIPEIAADAGISIPDALGSLAGGLPGLIGWGLPLLLGSIGGLIPGANPNTLTGTAAAAKAAMIGLQFAADQPPTRAHITYEFGEVWPGQTYLGLAIQHVRDYASRTPA